MRMKRWARTVLMWSRVMSQHTRMVPSGSPPLYRLILIGLIISAMLQLATHEIPASISENTPPWFDVIFVAMQAGAAVVALGSLYLTANSSRHAKHLHRSLTLEWFGLVILEGVIIMNVVGVMFYNAGPPAAPSTWVWIMFGFWIARTRLPEITKALGELQR